MPIPEVESVLKGLAMGRARLLYGLDRVPDDRLDWSPGGSAKTPLQLAGKTAGFLHFLSHMTQTGTMPDRSAPQPPPPATREEAKAAVEAAFGRLEGVLSALTTADLERTVAVPWNAQVPLRDWIYAGPNVVAYHQGQLNFLQLCYGDEDPNIPPGWGQG